MIVKMLSRILLCAILAGSLAGQQPQGSSPFQISGTLVDAVTGQPIAHARVGIASVSKRDTFTTTMSGEDGRFLFTNVSPGKYSLVAQRRGYLAQSFDEHEGFSTAIVAGPDLNTADLVFRLAPECSISGRVSDEAGEAVRFAQITLYRVRNFDGIQETRVYLHETSDEEGFYRFKHLRPGRYFISVSAKPWYARRPWPKQPINNSIASTADVVVEEQGTSTLDVAYPVTFYPGVTEPTAATALVLKTGDKFVADIGLQPVPALHLRLPTDSSGASSRVYGMQLQSRLFDAPVQVPVETRSVAQGEVEILGIAPGHYELQFQETNQGKSAAFSSGEIDAVNSGPIRVEQRTSTASISATILLDPSSGASVHGSLQLVDRKTHESVSEQFSGPVEIEYQRSVLPGTYQVFLGGSNGEFIKTLSATGAVLRGRTLEIKEAGPVKLTVTIARGQGQVNGVALREGKPLAGAMILLVPPDPIHNQMLFRRDQSDSDGSFTLRSVVPGKYTLLALENGWDLEWSNPAVLKPFLARGQVIQVQQNGKYEVQVKTQ